jgi:Zn-dependent membrane protease YugP
MAGIALFSLAVLFSLVTLPVEFNASNRALKILKEYDVFDSDELSGTRKVLGAAAMTYVASALSAIGSLLRLMLIAKSNKRR